MKALMMIATFLTFGFFTANAQYDVLEKKGYYGTANNDYAYGAPNKYDNQYPENSKDNYTPNRDRSRDDYHNDHHDDKHNYGNDCPDCRRGHCHRDHRRHCDDNRIDYGYGRNMRPNIVVRGYDIDRYRKDRAELELNILGPRMVNASTTWRGNTLYVYLDYPYNPKQDVCRSKMEIDLGRLSRYMNYDVIVMDGVTRIELAHFNING